MSKKITLKKLAQLVEGTKMANLAARSTPVAKRIAIHEKHPRDETSDIMPTKKGKVTSNIKHKGTMLPSEDKKKATSKYKTTSSKATRKGEKVVMAPGRILWPIPVPFQGSMPLF